ncbi:MAG: 50S ribosomal protein L32 [Chloroflexi bacterium]|jgi:large subunit ribosomal protein L32|nr:50S ribosomal protein L32 [Chloroflexota bacterium]
MPPLPKRRVSSGRRDRRRAHDALKTSNFIVCPNCGEPRLPHRVCANCGHYQGREIIEVTKKD